jgi:hypothetical protein
LSASGGPALARAFGFTYVDLRGRGPDFFPDGNFFAGFLRTAPFGLFGVRPGYGLHAIAMYRLAGDFSSLSDTHAHGIDPMGGGHHFEIVLFKLVMPNQQNHAQMQGNFVLYR